MLLNSDQINEIAGALSKAQLLMKAPERDKKANYGQYSSLGSIISSCKNALNNNGITILQQVGDHNGLPVLVTTLAHTSGQFFRSYMPIKIPEGKKGLQDLGSAMTYLKRYSLSAMVCVDADEDDDATLSTNLQEQHAVKQNPKSPSKINPEQAVLISDLIEGNEDLKKKVLTKMKEKFGSVELKDVPGDAFNPFMTWIRSQIEKEVTQ